MTIELGWRVALFIAGGGAACFISGKGTSGAIFAGLGKLGGMFLMLVAALGRLPW